MSEADAIETVEADDLGRERERTCIVTRQVLPETDLIRFVPAPDGTVVADLRRRLPGRGVWVSLDRERVAEAVRKNLFARSLKAAVKAPAELPDQVEARLRELALGRFGLARKAGAVVAGFSKVEAAIARDQLAGLVTASDGADDGRRKIEAALRRRFASSETPVPRPQLIRIFATEELGLALGRPNVIHAAVLHSPAGRSFVDASIRLRRYIGAAD
ncbi:hypothetical protein SAMN05216548_10580 [Faunimonas pinastri]|uniref:YlxR domain-containing protein n=1 Tax=Faunimonas pinastri TaxID=1855383 RepID=A0A1H9GLL8_9HYPH|nr:RNA-binding protein [Faunimonas pinastri]SEQ50981.1 hypothetical protein SAMN05216548_10580 [Faunimonas pinastri]